MTGIIFDLLLGPIGAILGAIFTAAVAFFAGRSKGKSEEKVKRLKDEVKAHERINEADVGVGATDSDRVKRLRRVADEWRD